MEDMPGGHISTFPSSHSVYVININIIFIFTSSFAGLCIQQKQMGNICPGWPVLLPGPRLLCLKLLVAHQWWFFYCTLTSLSSLTGIQQGPGVDLQAWPRNGSERRARLHKWWGAGIRDTRPYLGHLSQFARHPSLPAKLGPRLPPAVLLPSFDKQAMRYYCRWHLKRMRLV